MKTLLAAPDEELARRVIEQVEAHPETHNQLHIIEPNLGCACLTGWVALLRLDLELKHGVHKLIIDKLDETGDRRSISVHAAEWLGVNPGDFFSQVFRNHDRKSAIANFKVLTGV